MTDANGVLAALAGTEARRDRCGRGGVAGAGGRAGRGTRRGLRWARRAVADRPEGGPGPGDLHRRRAGPAHPQVPEQPPRRLPRPPGRRTRDRADHRRGADHGRRSRQRRRRSGADVPGPTPTPTPTGPGPQRTPRPATPGRPRQGTGAPRARTRRRVRLAGSGIGVGDRAGCGVADAARAALRWYGDSAYCTGDLRDAIERSGDQAVIKPKPVTPAVAGGFTMDDFTLDETAGVLTCPAGQTRPLSPRRSATFGALCRDCPLRARCTTSKTGRSLVLHEHDDLLRAARADWATDPAARGLPPPPPEHRARRLPGREPGRAAGQAALPRHHQEPRLAQATHRGAEPTQPDRSWPHPHRPNLGPGQLNSPGHGQRPPPSESTPPDPPSTSIRDRRHASRPPDRPDTTEATRASVGPDEPTQPRFSAPSRGVSCAFIVTGRTPGVISSPRWWPAGRLAASPQSSSGPSRRGATGSCAVRGRQ